MYHQRSARNGARLPLYCGEMKNDVEMQQTYVKLCLIVGPSSPLQEEKVDPKQICFETYFLTKSIVSKYQALNINIVG